MNRRNHGDSGSSNDFSPAAQFADVVAVVESIDGPVHLLGHSADANDVSWAAPQIDNLRGSIRHEPAAPPGEDVGDFLNELMTAMMALVDEGRIEEAARTVCRRLHSFGAG